MDQNRGRAPLPLAGRSTLGIISDVAGGNLIFYLNSESLQRENQFNLTGFSRWRIQFNPSGAV
jgi:hypothetical protein